MQNNRMIIIALVFVNSLSYSASDDKEGEHSLINTIAATQLEKELINSGRYALFKMVRTLYAMLELNVGLNERMLVEFKKNTDLGIYIVFNDVYALSPSDICMPWGRIYLSGRYSSDQKKGIESLLRKRLKVRHESFFQHLSCYQVLQIDNESLPNQLEREGEKGRPMYAIKAEWEVLNFMHKREKTLVWLNEYRNFYQSKAKALNTICNEG